MRTTSPSLPRTIPLTWIFFVSMAPRSPPLEPDSPLQVPWHLASQPWRSLRDSSHLWLHFPLRQFLQDFCPERHRLLSHAWPRLLLLRHERPRPLLVHRLWSRMAHHPMSGWPRRSSTSVVHGSPPRGYHSTTPSSATSCGRSGHGGACHSSGESSPDGYTGEGWLLSAT
jgi:hypothetical protein